MQAKLLVTLILAETIVLLALIWTSTAITDMVILAVLVVLVVLAMVVGGAAQHIPATLRAVFDSLRWRK